MDGWIMFARALFWVGIFAIAWLGLVRYYELQETRQKRRRVMSKPPRSHLLKRQYRQYQRRRTSAAVPAVPGVPRDISSYKPLDDAQLAHARWLIETQDYSNNKLYEIWKGSRNKRMQEFAELRAQIEAERLAQAIADPSIEVEDMAPVPT